MSRNKNKTSNKKKAPKRTALRAEGQPSSWLGGAPSQTRVGDDLVHVFVDDQNLFFGIVNDSFYGRSFRIDFGQLLLEAARDATGRTRGVASAYIAGIIPDDDSFWRIAENQGFTVRRGYLNAYGRSKQDDAYLITDLTATVCERPTPSTAVLVAGDADYSPPLQKALQKGWRTEVAFVARGVSTYLNPYVHQFRIIQPVDIQYSPL